MKTTIMIEKLSTGELFKDTLELTPRQWNAPTELGSWSRQLLANSVLRSNPSLHYESFTVWVVKAYDLLELLTHHPVEG